MKTNETSQACHLCGNETEWVCRNCDAPVCEECCVPYDQFTQIDYALCTSCHEGNQALEYLWRHKKWKIEDAKKKERLNRNKLAKARYWKPENVEKRRIAREERKRREAELAREQLAQALKIVGNWLG